MSRPRDHACYRIMWRIHVRTQCIIDALCIIVLPVQLDYVLDLDCLFGDATCLEGIWLVLLTNVGLALSVNRQEAL